MARPTQQTFTRQSASSASPDVQRVLSDLYDKLSQVQALIVDLQARVSVLEKKP